jgi:DNA repair protein RecO (recombination protein O)
MTKSDRIALQPGFVLQLRPYRDTSALVELFTRDVGRVGLVARGARRPKHGTQGTLQPFHPILVSWVGGGDLGTLTSAEADGPPLPLKGKPLFCSYYLNELLLRLLARHDPHPRLHADYGAAIARLAQAGDAAALERTLRIFEKRLLQELGYGLLLEQEAEGGVPVDPSRMYSYRLEKGPLPGEDPTGMQVQGHTLLGLAREEIEGTECLREAKRLLRAALALYLGDRPLRSREFFRKAAAGSSRDAPGRPAAPSK